MVVVNLRFRTLGGQTYRLPVKPTTTIHNIKMNLLDKIRKDNDYPINKNILDDVTIRLTYIKNDDGEFQELQNGKVSDYPELKNSPMIMISIDTLLFKVHVIDVTNGYELDIHIKPDDTIFDVKKKIYEKLLTIPDYTPHGSVLFEIRAPGGQFMLIPSLTVSQYPAIEKGRILEMVVEDEQFRIDVVQKVGKYTVHTVQDNIPFHYLMTGRELKNLVTVPDDFNLHIGSEHGTIIEDDVHLFEYPTMVYNTSLFLVYPNHNNSTNSNSSNRNYGGRRRTIRKQHSRHTKRKQRKT